MMTEQRCTGRLRPAGILLDFYGTVVGEDDDVIDQICREIALASSLRPAASEVGRWWSSLFSRLCRQSVGPSFRPQKELELASLRDVLEHFRADLDPGALSQALYDYCRRPAMSPESRSVLEQCDVPVCLVSNIDNAELLSALRHNGLSFEHVVTSEDCRAYKPRPEMFREALSALDTAVDQVLCVGDSLGSDVAGARAMEMPVLWINRTGRTVPAGKDEPDYVASDLTGLLDVLNAETES